MIVPRVLFAEFGKCMEITKIFCLAIIMFGLGLGLTVQDFTRVVKNPRDFFVGFIFRLF